MTDDSSYGARFAKTWSQLQMFLADLDPLELAKLEDSDMAQTVDLLTGQRQFGSSALLAQPTTPPPSPETLALAIVRERLNALEAANTEVNPDRFGAQFLQAWRGQGGLLSCFKYAEIQRLKRADREDCLDTLGPVLGVLSYVERKQLAAATPQSLALALKTALRNRDPGAGTFMWFNSMSYLG